MNYPPTLSAFMVVFVIALVVSMALIPAMIRLAPHIGMVDKPDARKVHAAPIPRAGGIGIVLGALVPMLITLPMSDLMISYYIGALTLLVFGVWDDIVELGHYVKFIGQFVAAVVVVYYGGVAVETMPLMGLDRIPAAVGQPFTVIAIVGMINAINHSDGLDGLAGGESLMSLAGILFLAQQASGYETMVIAVAVMGGVFGFLRFNSHPARVFMGDGGSQFLGFSLGVLAVVVTQRDNPALSPALPLLLLGLPIADILVVFWKRARGGGNWFKATKNHIHHRLLELGFHHYESVTIIYSIQAMMVLVAVTSPYAHDMVLLITYLVICALVLVLLGRAESRGWKARESGVAGPVGRLVSQLQGADRIERYATGFVSLAVSGFMIAGVFGVRNVPADFAVIAAVLGALLIIRLVLGYRVWFLMLRLLVFMAIALMVYLVNTHPAPGLLAVAGVGYGFFGMLLLGLVVAVRLTQKELFSVTPLDFLVLLIVLVLIAFPGHVLQESGSVEMVLQSILLFYGAEFAMRQMRSRWNLFTGSIVFALAALAFHGALS